MRFEKKFLLYIFRAVLFILGLAIIVQYGKIALHQLSFPINIEINLEQVNLEPVTVRGISETGGTRFPSVINDNRTRANTLTYLFEEDIVKDLYIDIATEDLVKLRSVIITIGDKTYTFDKFEIQNNWSRELYGFEPYVSLKIPINPDQTQSIIAIYGQSLNWKGDVWALFYISCMLLLIGMWIYFPIGVKRYKAKLMNILSSRFIHKKNNTYWNTMDFIVLCSGALVFSAFMIYLEYRQPFFFTQDDNLSQFLPVILYSYKYLDMGIFSTWNPYQLLGAPTFEVGTYALTYPFTYLSYKFADIVIGNKYDTIEVFAVFHLLVGYIATYILLRKIGIRSLLSGAGSLSFVFSGYLLMAGRSWYYMTPSAVWFPLVMLSLVMLNKKESPVKWIVFVGLISGVYFHAGNAQMWAYSMMFFFLGVILLVCTKQVSYDKLLMLVPAFFLGGAIAAPLLIPQIDFMSQVLRHVGSGAGLFGIISTLVFPYTFVNAAPFTQTMYVVSIFSGIGLFTIFLFFIVFIVMPWNQTLKDIISNNIWIILSQLSFLLSLGSPAVVWKLMSMMPVFNKFQHPFKFMLFTNLFFIILSSLILERIMEGRLKKLLSYGIVIAVLALLTYHISLPLGGFYNFTIKPYPSLPAQFIQLQSEYQQRVISIAPERSPSNKFTNSLKLNFPTVYSLASIDGYDPIVANTIYNIYAKKQLNNHFLHALKAYGVKWVISDVLSHTPAYGDNKYARGSEHADIQQIKKFDRIEDVRTCIRTETGEIKELMEYDPIVFISNNKMTNLPFYYTGNGLIIDTSSLTDNRKLVVNFLWRPNFLVYTSQQIIVPEKDNWGRMTFTVPEDSNLIEVKYNPDWEKAMYFSLGAGIMFFISLVIIHPKLRKEHYISRDSI